ncbi:MAG: sulfotransferase domain-containing protein, partial [Gammaproteobacteria bacterium]
MNSDVVIFVAGMSRAASMWTYNVVREILKTSGHIPWPEKIPPNEGPAIEHVLRQPAGPGRTWCIKTHQVIPLGQPNVKIICNYRDVRDAVFSFMNFMKYPFIKGQVATQAMMDKTKCDLQTMMDKTDYYLKKPDNNILPVKYNDVTGQPDEVIRHIARFLDLVISDSSIETISRHFARENVKRRLDKLNSVPLTANGAVADKKLAGDYIGIRN